MRGRKCDGDRRRQRACTELYRRDAWSALLLGALVRGAGHGAPDRRDVWGARRPDATPAHLADGVSYFLRCLLLPGELPHEAKLRLLPQV